jgi:exonuclease SbcD
MRVLHFAGLHLGVETYGGVDPAIGLSTRLNDVLKALDEVVEYALGENVEVVG